MLSTLLNNYNVKKYDIVNSNSSKIQENILNTFPIYVINLREDKTRRNYIKILFKKYKLNYSLIIVEKFKYESQEIINNLKIRDCILGCILSHLWCIKNAVCKKYKRFIIFEDDIIFHKNFDSLFKKIMNSSIENIDLLMLGALDINVKTNQNNLKNDEIIYYPTSNILGAHANIYKLEFATEFLNYKLNTTPVIEFDFDYHIFMNKYKIGICLPNLVVCELSTTNIDHKFSPLLDIRYESYKKWFPLNFTYDDYEYILIIFINFIQEQINSGVTFNNLEEMTQLFARKYRRSRHIKYVSESILNSGYNKEDIMELIEYINNDCY